ncbi:DUF2182 domain-containing protein [Mycolicibacterium boenickei]
MTTVGSRPSAWRRLWWAHPELSLLAVAVAAWVAVVVLHSAVASHGGVQHCSVATYADVARHHGTVDADTALRCTEPFSRATRFPTDLALWVLMTAAMMLPTTLPATRSISLNGKWNRRHRNQALFAVGYLAVWAASGAVVLAVVGLLGPKAAGALAVAGSLAIAAAWELTRRKRLFLRACHRVRSLPADGGQADRACVREGLRNGVQCAGACGPMMLPMVLAPHALWLMVAVFAVVAGEKWVTKAVDHLRLSAAVLVLMAVIVAFGAPLG